MKDSKGDEVAIWPEPWIVRTAIQFLERIIKPGWLVFEWGSGASTLWLLRHACRVTTVEHDRAWYDAVIEAAGAEGLRDRLSIMLAIAHQEDPDSLVSYARAAYDFMGGIYDLVFLDGLDGTRGFCAPDAVRLCRPGGYVLLDNSGAAAHADAMLYLTAALGGSPEIVRGEHEGSIADLGDAVRCRFIGPVATPGPGAGVTETCIWRKRE